MKWVEDSETVAIGADNGGIERIEIKFPSGYVPAQVSQVQVQLQKASAHLASAA